jgi:hypothetical protein
MSSPRTSEKPEERELRKKAEELAACGSALAEKELSLATLRAELRKFERQYLLATGYLFARLDELEADIAEGDAALRSGDPGAQRTADQARERATRSAAAADSAGAASAPLALPSSRTKELYRALAKRAHPDLVTDEAERTRRVAIMAEVNAAYERGDEARLEQLLDDLETSPEAVTGEGTAADLVRIIRRIARVERRLEEIDREFAAVRASAMHELLVTVKEAEAKGIDHLAQICRSLESSIAEAERRLAEIQ